MSWLLPLTLEHPGRYAIHDVDGEMFIHEDYKALGESEGWLSLAGKRVDENGHTIWIFRQV